MSDLLDQAERAQAPKVSGDTRHGEMGQEARQIGTADAPDVELRPLQGAQESLLGLCRFVWNGRWFWRFEG
ncbi:hypothetical protein, partial [Accumulibacter sp.]|uniref:hypothetical protein n=1 Tax=Accumulibacter sp. TaxID=2053492 RepID=UPI002D1FB575